MDIGYFDGYIVFLRLLYMSCSLIMMLAVFGLIYPDRLFGSRIFAAIALFMMLQFIAIGLAMENYATGSPL